jgi:serine/arginine repetitive matrix protein 2
MILETLGRIRAKNAGIKGGGSEGFSSPNSSQVSIQTSKTLPQLYSSANRSKRYSNNLFGSGRFRDYSYVRSVAQQKRGRTASTTSTGSVTVGASIASYESDTANSSLLTTAETTEHHVPSSVYTDNAPMSVAEHRMSKLMTPSALKRASLALEEAMNQIEEEPDEEEEEIVMPRLTQSSRLSHNAPHVRPSPISQNLQFHLELTFPE